MMMMMMMMMMMIAKQGTRSWGQKRVRKETKAQTEQ
jgi:hypothetical protein